MTLPHVNRLETQMLEKATVLKTSNDKADIQLQNQNSQSLPELGVLGQTIGHLMEAHWFDTSLASKGPGFKPWRGRKRFVILLLSFGKLEFSLKERRDLIRS